MKVGLMTLHRSENYGSVLQALALQHVMERMGHEVVMMDYYPERYSSLGKLKRLKGKHPKFRNPIFLFAATMLMIPSYRRRYVRFRKFVNKYLAVSKSFASNEEARPMPWDVDVFCTGSDQVWNSIWNEGVDKTLFLDFVPDNANVFSYASSFGVSSLDASEKEEIKGLLSKYKYLSVREDTGVEILRDLGREDGELVLDPTLLMTKDEWMKFVGKKPKYEKYILTYNLHHDSRIDSYALSLKEKYGLPIVNISYNVHDIVRKGKLCWCPYVEDFLSYFLNASYVISDSFHATVFSLLFEKKFVTIAPEVASSRMSSLLKILGLENRIVSSEITPPHKIEQEIDYEKVSSLLKAEREKSISFLRKAMQPVR